MTFIISNLFQNSSNITQHSTFIMMAEPAYFSEKL